MVSVLVWGIGIDTVEVYRVRGTVEKFGQRFLDRVFHPAESERGLGTPGWYASLAGRFAAKEAVLKALGMGLRGCTWRDVEIFWDRLGKPSVRLHGELERYASEKGIKEVKVSISHSRDHAAAVAVAVNATEDAKG